MSDFLRFGMIVLLDGPHGVVKTGARALEFRRAERLPLDRRAPEHGRQEILQWPVARSRREIEPDSGYAKVLEKIFESRVFDASRERAAAHDPGVNLQGIAAAPPLHHP